MTARALPCMRAGHLGIFGDFLFSVSDRTYGKGAVDAWSGPTIAPLIEMGLVIPLEAIKKSLEGKPTEQVLANALSKELREAKGFMPGVNVWYAKAAIEHMVFQRVMEMLSPGYLRTIRARTERAYGQQWWWAPGEATPDRAPDAGAAIKGR